MVQTFFGHTCTDRPCAWLFHFHDCGQFSDAKREIGDCNQSWEKRKLASNVMSTLCRWGNLPCNADLSSYWQYNKSRVGGRWITNMANTVAQVSSPVHDVLPSLSYGHFKQFRDQAQSASYGARSAVITLWLWSPFLPEAICFHISTPVVI